MGVSRLQSKLNHVLWVNEAADFVGGCEQYIYNTVSLLRERGVGSTLLYDCNHGRFSTDFVKPFDGAFPMVDIKSQVADIRPDVIYVHRLTGTKPIHALKETGVPTARFFHDTKMVCPREHRYTTIGHKTCEKPMGARCYFPCMGVVNRSEGAFGLRLNPVHTLRAELKANSVLGMFIVASTYMATLFVEHGIPASCIRVNPLYAVAPCDATPVAREKNLFLFVGQLVRSKGIDTLLKAMALLEQPATLAIIGRGRQEVMFKELATKLGVERKVRFVGHVSQTELSDWYRRAACLVLPVRQPESFALVGPEAMSHGTPAVATNIGGVGTWLVDGETGLNVPPNDAGALARAMDRVMTSDGLCATMGKNALKRYNELFRPEMHLDVLMQIFRDLLKARAPV